jgi:hypothetical protein
MHTFRFWIFAITIRPCQGWHMLFNWDLQIGSLSISLDLWRSHKLGIGWYPDNSGLYTWHVKLWDCCAQKPWITNRRSRALPGYCIRSGWKPFTVSFDPISRIRG